LLLLLPREIPESRSVLGETQYVVHIVRLRHFDDKMEESNSRFVGSGVKQFRQRIQCESTSVASIASLKKLLHQQVKKQQKRECALMLAIYTDKKVIE